MRLSDSSTYNIPKPIQYANSNSSPFISDESLSDDTYLPHYDQTLSPNDLSTQTPSNTNFLQILIYLLNQFSKLLALITPLTEPVTHLKTNHHHLLQIIEIPKLITNKDNNQKWIIVFSYRHPNFEQFISFFSNCSNYSHKTLEILFNRTGLPTWILHLKHLLLLLVYLLHLSPQFQILLQLVI